MRKLKQALGLFIIFFTLTAFLTFFCAGCEDSMGKFAWSKMPEYIVGSALTILACVAIGGLTLGMAWGLKQFTDNP